MSHEEKRITAAHRVLTVLAAAAGNRAARACRAERRGAEHGTADGNHGAHRGRPRQNHPTATAAGGLTGSTRILPGRRRSRGLAYLDEMTVRIADVGPPARRPARASQPRRRPGPDPAP